jgi:thiol-disulfide isomerase/thioredoxin
MNVLQNGQNVSLAQVAAKSSTPYTLFQFVGVTCESCKTEAPYVSKVLSKYTGSVSRVLIFPNQADEYQTSEYMGFSSNYASGSSYLIDDSLAVIKKVRAKTTQYFGVFVLVGKDGKGLVLNEEQAYLGVDTALQSVTKK